MGSEWCYAHGHGPDAHDRSATGVICFIMDRPVIVHEARQGGVVAEPLQPSHPAMMRSARDAGDRQWRDLVDLTDERTLDGVVADRLIHAGRTLT